MSSFAGTDHWKLTPFGAEDWPTARRLLLACYPSTPAALWDRGAERLRQVPCGTRGDTLGMLLTGSRGPQGLALLLASQRPTAAGPQRHVNGSSWAILPPARGRALWMARTGLAEKDTAYTALTPITSVHRLLQRIGFRAVTHQHVLAATPHLAWSGRQTGATAQVLAGRAALHALRDDPLVAALHDHLQLGCEVLALQHEEGVQGWLPLVFRSQRRLRCLPTAELLYAASQQRVVEHAPALAAALLKRGYLLLGFDAHEDIRPEFACTRLFQRRYARGLTKSMGVDHLYSELVYLHR